MTFPIYRKYEHNRNFFKIINEKEFIELQIIGTKYHINEFKAKIFPDFTLIRDLISLENNLWLKSSKEEFDNQMNYANKHLSKL
jgi:hypothetical protein